MTNDLRKAYQAMLQADGLHGALRREHTYKRVMHAQQTYYALLTAYNKERYADTPLTLARIRAKTMFIRATQNKRSALTKQQAQIADYQWRRALHLLQRANNAIQIDKEQRMAEWVAEQEARPPQTVNTIHPITRRRVQVTREQAARWKQ